MTPGSAISQPTRLPPGRRLLRRAVQSGQATAEYALVLLGVALIAVLVLDWARNTNMISRLLNAVFRSISKLIT